MSFELFKSLINQFRHSRFTHRKIDLTGVGEPLLHPKLVSMVEHAKERGLEASFTSNFTIMSQRIASDLVKAKLDCLYVSVDAASKETFEKIRSGATFETVIENVRSFVRTRNDLTSDRPVVMFRSTISEENAGEVTALLKLAQSLGVDGITFFPQLIPDKEYYFSDLLIQPRPKNTKMAAVEVSMPSHERALTCRSYSRCYITFDGKVLPCPCLTQMIPREQYSRFQLGDLRTNSFSDIWFSPRYKQFRARGALGDPYLPICENCPYCPGNSRRQHE